MTDSLQRVTRISYNAEGQATSVTLPDGKIVTYTIINDRLASVGSNGTTTSYTYDSNRRLTRATSGSSAVKFAYDAIGRVTAMTRVTDVVNDTGPTTTFAYYDRSGLDGCPAGGAGRTVETMPSGSTVTYCYDSRLEILSMKSSAPESPVIDALAVPDYAEHLGVGQAEAKALLELQRKSDDLPEAVTASSSGPGYAGLWFDESSRRIKLGLTSGTSTAGATQAISTLGISGGTDIVSVAHTQQELEDARDALSAPIDDLIVQGKVSTSFQTDTNSVGVDLAASISTSERDRVKQAVASISPVPATVRDSTEPLLLAVEEESCHLGACDFALRGGQHFVPGGQEFGCTTGFTSKAADNKRYVITAGHCLRGSDPQYTVGWRYTRQLIGYRHVSATSPHEGARGDFGLLGINSESPFYYPEPTMNWVNVDASPV